MSLFKCDRCGCVENTALCRFWLREELTESQALCSECDTGKWHGLFPKRDADAQGYRPRSEGSPFIECSELP